MLHPESKNTSVSRKQDKSKIHKFSPLKIKENNIQQKIKRKSLSRKGGSNSFLGTALPQKAKMAIQKGRKEDKKKKAKKKTAKKKATKKKATRKKATKKKAKKKTTTKKATKRRATKKKK